MEALNAFRRFALSVDIVTENIKEQIVEILDNICVQILGASFYAVKVRKLDQDGNYTQLQTIWSNLNDEGVITPIFSNERYTGQATFAYDNNIKLWINEENGEFLNANIKCVDSWSGTENLPQYWAYNQPDTKNKTSVILPLTLSTRDTPFGIINIESENHYQVSKRSKEIFEDIAKSVAILSQSYDMRFLQAKNTSSILRELRELTNQTLSILEKPSVFVAFPLKCNQDILGLIKTVTEGFESKYDFVFWNEMNDSGSIDEQLIKEITRSKYGIVYFSEKTDSNSYVDNPNVVFEAGMFHAITSESLSTEPKRWIPIREANAGPKPFDFAHERMIEIERDSTRGEILNPDKLSKLLAERLDEF